MGVKVSALLMLYSMIINVKDILEDCVYYNYFSNNLDCSETNISDYDSNYVFKTIINDLTEAFSAQDIHLQDL